MKQLILSIALTILLGPGTGHLYLRRFRRGLVLILIVLFFSVHLAFRVLGSLGGAEIAQQQLPQLFADFTAANPRAMLFYDAVFAAVWAFALVDVYRLARPPREREESGEAGEEQES